MLDKLKRNKMLKKLAAIIPLSLLLIVSVSCSFSRKVYKVNTEIICPNGVTILVESSNAKDLGDAIQLAYRNKKRLRTSENYTPVRLRDGRSFMLKIPPELVASCSLSESLVGQVEHDYIHHFTR
jgi:hypothetical protein